MDFHVGLFAAEPPARVSELFGESSDINARL